MLVNSGETSVSPYKFLGMGRTICDDIFGEGYRQPINQKKKGNRNELVVCKILEKWTGSPFSRVPSSGGLRWKNNKSICGDVVCTDESVYFPFSVETKHLKELTVRKYLRTNSKVFTIYQQAKRDAERAGKIPMMLLRCNGMKEGEYWVFVPGDAFTLFGREAESVGSIADSQGNDEYLYGWKSTGLFSEVSFADVIQRFNCMF